MLPREYGSGSTTCHRVFNNGWIVSDVFWKLWFRALELYDYFRGTSANTHDMKDITNTVDNIVVKSPSINRICALINDVTFQI
jgi:hypothetical protein